MQNTHPCAQGMAAKEARAIGTYITDAGGGNQYFIDDSDISKLKANAKIFKFSKTQMNINKNTGDIEINENFHVNKDTSTKEIKNINFLEGFGEINEFETYSIQSINFLNLETRVNFRFKNGILYIIEIIWTDGITNRLGYNSSHSEMINEKKYLSKLVSKSLGQSAEISTKYEDFFSFSWGHILIKADQKSSFCSIMIIYGKNTNI
ncbi:hypothetical protein LE191_23570 [Janthinobacterium sp. HSC-3S05]|uniref:hypothetical protein n=1 Tax=Janthinobacterium lividum TaxID=29581 RepID=UPI001CD8F639|nr:hypothetical protein [Janthinobacterium lividum]MCA1863098.1 hypothetical protein [Janthinobacterium lividum]